MFRWIFLFQNDNVFFHFPLSCTCTCGTITTENNNKSNNKIELILRLFNTTSITTMLSVDSLLCNGKAFRAVTEDTRGGSRSLILTPIGEDDSLQSASSHTEPC